VTTLIESPSQIRLRRVRRLLPGLLVALLIGAVASAVARLVPVLGAPVLALLLGVAIRTWAEGRDARARQVAAGSRQFAEGSRQVGAGLQPGAAFAGRYLLQVAIVALGAGLSVRAVLHIGVHSLPVLLGTLALCLGSAWLLGRLLRIPDPLRTLIGAGTGICGASAIAAIGPVIEADGLSMAYAVGTIVVYNITAVLLFPALGHLLNLSQQQFGLFAGTAVNDTSSVVATGYAYGTAAGQYAVTVKLTRALMIIPVVLGLVALRSRRPSGNPGGPTNDAASAHGQGGDSQGTNGRGTNGRGTNGRGTNGRGTNGQGTNGQGTNGRGGDGLGGDAAGNSGSTAERPALYRLVPPFLVFFLLAAAANSVGLVPAGGQPGLARLAAFLVAVALGGIGLGVRLGELRRAGLRPLLFGGLLSLIVAGSSLTLQALT
jgi:uncharacterized integral membrane protein (TIGR00698 family)